MPPTTPLVVQTIKHITVVTFSDPSIVDSRVIEAIRAELDDLVEKRDRRWMILDLSRVQHLSSAALGVLVPLQKSFEDRKGQLVLCGLRKEVGRIFKLTGLTSMFRIRKSEQAALRDFGVTIE